jgi:hypothetical protein
LRHLNRDFAQYNAAYAESLSEPFPVRTMLGSDLSDIPAAH